MKPSNKANTKKEFNARQELFIQNLCKGMTQTAAYIAAGYSRRNARISASLAITNYNIRAEVDARLSEVKQAAKDHLENKAIDAAEKMTELMSDGGKDEFCQLYAAKDVLDRIGLKPREEVNLTGNMAINFTLPKGIEDDEL